MNGDSEQSTGASRRERTALFAAIVAIVAVHLALIGYFDHPSMLFSDRPLAGGDYDTHIEQTWRVLEGLDGWGKTWVYDVHLLAGHPNGIIFDADNKGWELWTYALWKLGFPKGTAFNLFLLAAHLSVLPAAFASARLFGLGNLGATVAMALASMVWFFDAFSHWCWYVGMLAYAFANVAFLVPMAMFHKFVRSRRAGWALATMLVLGVCHLIHPYTFIILVLPMTVMYGRAFRTMRRRDHAMVVAIAAGVIGINAYWLLVAFQFWHYILDSAYFGQTGLSYLALDFLGMLRDPSATGILGSRSGFRFVAIALAVVGLVVWRRRDDERWLPFAIGLGVMLAFTYLGTYVGVIAQIQPYRHIMPATFFAIIPAAGLVEHVWRERILHGLPRLAYAVGAVIALPGLQHLARDVLYFVADELPEVVPLLDGTRVSLSATGYPDHLRYRHYPVKPEYDDLARWVRAHDDGQSRFLVQVSVTGEQLAWQTDAQLLGGFPQRNLAHSYSNLFRIRPQGIAHPEELRPYFEAYAVKWLIVTFRRPWFDAMPDLYQLEAQIGTHRVYRVNNEASLFATGDGTVDARTNEIHVAGTDPGEDLVLRYHWLETLVCEPDCEVGQADNPVGKVPFVSISAPHPSEFTVRNGY